MSRFVKTDPEEALSWATDKFIRRFRKVDEQVRAEGRSMEDMTPEELDALWERAKKA